jgi:endonuclease YncB( thermonuclease family)
LEILKNTLTAIFLSIFCFAIFSIPNSKNAASQSNNFRVKSHLKFDQKFSGTAKVIDGDSIRVGEKEVRLFGIDAPEYSQNCFDERNLEYPCGEISQKFLFKLAHKKDVECFYAELDKYKRYLAKCFIKETSINEEIIKNGMAVIYDFNNSEEDLEKLEETAKEQKIGIWRGAFELPKDYRKKHPRK